MYKAGRNDPCPCGSGKKFKKCCLGTERPPASRSEEERNAVGAAITWLKKRYPEEVDEAVLLDYLGEPEEEDLDAIHDLPEGRKRMLEINIAEWLLADAFLELDGKRVRALDLVLGTGGALLPAGGKDWLLELKGNPLSLYEVRRATPGEGLELKDLLRNDRPSVPVIERSASTSLFRWDVFGARLCRQDDGWVLSGALYPMPREKAVACRDEILREMAGEDDWDSDLSREVVGCIISDHWIDTLVEPIPKMNVVDASTGDPIALVVEHYRVSDWKGLSDILAAQPDVEGDLRKGWVRYVEMKDGMRRSRASLNRKDGEVLELFCRTLKFAEEARVWFEGIAANVARFKSREIVDPTSPEVQEDARQRKSNGPEIPPEEQAQFVREYLQKHYDGWADHPLPALDGKTPRQTVRTKKGRQAVVELLKEFELHEARKAREQGGDPFDFTFLWRRLKLEGER